MQNQNSTTYIKNTVKAEAHVVKSGMGLMDLLLPPLSFL